MNRAEEKRLAALEAAAQQSAPDADAHVVRVSDACGRCRGACKGHEVPAVSRGAAVVLRIADRTTLTPPPGPGPDVLAALKADAVAKRDGKPGLSIEALIAIDREEKRLKS